LLKNPRSFTLLSKEGKKAAVAAIKNPREEERIMKKAKETKRIWKGWVDPTCTPVHVK